MVLYNNYLIIILFKGKPLEGVELKVVDENGSVVSVGTQGELCVRTCFRFATYRGMEELFHEVVDSQNWIHTGDMARIRADGNYVIDGRKREMISIGLHKFFPWSIEKTLRKIPGAKNVFAVGVPDIRLGQVVCACVLPEPGSSLSKADVKQFCDEMFLEKPTAFGINVKPIYHIIMDQVPLTGSGKVDRRTIGLMAKEKLGL